MERGRGLRAAEFLWDWRGCLRWEGPGCQWLGHWKPERSLDKWTAHSACLVFHTSVGTSGEGGRLLDMGECSGSSWIHRGGKQVLLKVTRASPLDHPLPSPLALCSCACLWIYSGKEEGGESWHLRQRKVLRVPVTLVYLALDSI